MAPAVSITSGALDKVWELKTLGWRRDAEAKKMLECIAAQVQPIMQKRKWRVSVLSEFYPENRSLLGLNIGGGDEVRIRLRLPDNADAFFPFEHLLGTMLHELCHNEHGPHSASFYKLLDEITRECEELISKGITGTSSSSLGSFAGSGRRVGSTRFVNLPQSRDGRAAAAAAAAERRSSVCPIMPAGGRRLGGDSFVRDALSPAQAAAMAAERRRHDDLWCVGARDCTDTHADAHPHAHATDLNERPQHDNCGEDGKDAPGKTNGNEDGDKAGTLQLLSNRVNTKRHRVGEATNNPHCAGEITGRVSNQDEWECGICTLINKPLSLCCDACGAVRSSPTASPLGLALGAPNFAASREGEDEKLAGTETQKQQQQHHAVELLRERHAE